MHSQICSLCNSSTSRCSLFKDHGFGYLRLVDLLTPIGHLVAYDGADVLDDHGVLLQVFSSIQTQALDAGSGQVHVVLPLRLQAPVLGRLGVDKLLAVWRVELPREGALVGLGHTGAVQSVGPLNGKKGSIHKRSVTFQF